MDDWDSNTSTIFVEKLTQFKASAEAYRSSSETKTASSTSDYQVIFVSKGGERTIKSFERAEISKRGMLLHNQISKSLEAMGQAISEQEKRQVLIDILEKFC